MERRGFEPLPPPCHADQQSSYKFFAYAFGNLLAQITALPIKDKITLFSLINFQILYFQ